MSYKMVTGEPEKYVIWHIKELEINSSISIDGKDYEVKAQIANKDLRCNDYGHSILFEKFLVDVEVIGDDVFELIVDIRHCFDVDADDGFIDFDEDAFNKLLTEKLKEIKWQYSKWHTIQASVKK